MTLAFREAGPGDAARLAEIGAATFVETFGPLYSAEDLAAFLAQVHRPESWAAELADPALKVLLVEQDGEPVAYAKIGPRSLPYQPGGEAMELKQFYVLKPWQGEGIAPRLMDWVLAQARERGADEICLSVWTGNHRAKSFYARYGFSYVGPYAFMVGEQADEDEIWVLVLPAAGGRGEGDHSEPKAENGGGVEGAESEGLA